MIEKTAHSYLEVIERAAETPGVRCESVHVTSDFPADTILTVAKKRKCDLIYMASHGRRGIAGRAARQRNPEGARPCQDFGTGPSLSRSPIAGGLIAHRRGHFIGETTG